MDSRRRTHNGWILDWALSAHGMLYSACCMGRHARSSGLPDRFPSHRVFLIACIQYSPPNTHYTTQRWCSNQTALIGFITSFSLQERFLGPSRIRTTDLERMFHLPSRLSRYDQVTISDNTTLGVHFIKYAKTVPAEDYGNGTVMYFNHGFGASSLSWLPAITPLSKRLNATLSLAHDACGFGFTERPTRRDLFRVESSAEIGLGLLRQQLRQDVPQPTRLILFGHSMGALATIAMAAQIPEHVPVTVVLVAPAFAVFSRRSKTVNNDQAQDSLGGFATRLKGLMERTVDVPVSYTLRRLVGYV